MLRPLILVCCFALAACSQTVGGYRQAAPSLAEPGADAVDTRGTYLDLIRRMQKQGAYYASLAHIEAFRQRHGDSPALRLLQADALRHTGQLDAAGTLYDGLTRGEQAAAAWHGLGLIAAQRDQDAVAEAALARAAQLTPLDTAVLGDLGYARLRAGQLEQARAPLAQALELAPDDARAVANLAVWALLRGDTATAERLMQQGKVSETTRAEVQRQAIALRQRRPAVATAAAAAAPAQTAPAPAAAAGRADSVPRRVPVDPRAVSAVVQGSTERRDPTLPATMLERFGRPTPATESTR
ncbi:MAG: Flp pilus assembly protein TadD [Stenotrophomonas sp.]|uniref:Flp pilus assembly protein TadD n=1 Tax=Stenotrophomonas sp. TaxID=69392 RepID=UPI0029A9714A|nr:Flp pilus assembly protein TadD [Stenotrophomonas sp.]MDX3933015.1 Flp pilus assembly protein TadD [Stenotrophomonas sp.]